MLALAPLTLKQVLPLTLQRLLLQRSLRTLEQPWLGWRILTACSLLALELTSLCLPGIGLGYHPAQFNGFGSGSSTFWLVPISVIGLPFPFFGLPGLVWT